MIDETMQGNGAEHPARRPPHGRLPIDYGATSRQAAGSYGHDLQGYHQLMERFDDRYACCDTRLPNQLPVKQTGTMPSSTPLIGRSGVQHPQDHCSSPDRLTRNGWTVPSGMRGRIGRNAQRSIG